MGDWSALQQKALYIDPFNLTTLPRNFVVTCNFYGDCAWENECFHFFHHSDFTYQEKLFIADCRTLEFSLRAAAWTPQIWAPSYLFTYSFEVIQDYLKTSLDPTLFNSQDRRLTVFFVLFLFVLQIIDEYLWKGHALATMELSHLSDSWCQGIWKQNHKFWEEQNIHSRDREEICAFLQRSSLAGWNSMYLKSYCNTPLTIILIQTQLQRL